MCGVLGFVGLDCRIPEEVANAHRDRLAHRGPDAAGALLEDGVYLGHRRLAILDLSPLGNQPMVSGCGRFVLAYNGEVYNFRELREQLVREGVRLRSQSDTEVVLELLARRGESKISSLNGIFAFALWDRQRRRLVLARDHFGVKPLYVARVGAGLAFASETKALTGLLPSSAGFDPRRLVQLLTFQWIPEPWTMAPEIHKLPPGHLGIWESGRYREEPYWDLRDEPEGTRRQAPAELIAETRKLVDAAVERQLLSDVPVGAFLSGGLDSSTIVARAVHRVPGMPVYTMSFAQAPDEGFEDDFPHAVRAARRLGAALHPIEIDPDVVSLLPAVVEQLDDPVADPGPINTYLICKAARAAGSVVVLSGQGGDEVFGGYRRHLAILLGARLGRVGRAAARRLGDVVPRPTSGSLVGPLRRLRKFLVSLEEPTARCYAALSVLTPPEDVLRILAPDVRRAIDGFDAFEAHVDAWNRAEAAGCSTLGSALYTDVATFLPSLNLLYSDKMSMATSVELRVPFLDLDLVRFAWSLPTELKVRWTGRRYETKYALREAARPWLGRRLVSRPKAGFGAPVRTWTRGPLQPLLRDVLAPRELRQQGLFDPDAVSRLLDEHASGAADHGYLLWGLLTFQLWQRSRSRDGCGSSLAWEAGS